MLISLTVGKVDAGVAVLLTEDKRLVSAVLPYTRRSYYSPWRVTLAIALTRNK